MNNLTAYSMERPRARRSRGFTLIELIIAMLIAATLAAIAIPAYNSYVRQGRRTDAKSALLDMASLEERYFTTQNIYSQTPSDLGYTGVFPVTVGSGYYQVAITSFLAASAPTTAAPAGTPASYTLQATPLGDQLKDAPCQTFTLTSGGVQTSAPATTGCW